MLLITVFAFAVPSVMAARELVDKQPSPTAGVIYSQSVKTTKVAEYAAFMRGGRSTDASAT
jgi:hypothetical protein